MHTRNVITELIPAFQNRFSTFETYGSTPFHQSFTKKELEGAVHLDSKIMYSVVLERDEEKGFIIHKLPAEAQFSPIFGILLEDLNNDNRLDIMLVGNSMADETFAGYYDASYGNVLINQGNFSWDVLPPPTSKFIADGDKKAFVKVFGADQTLYLVSENNGYLQAFGKQGRIKESTFAPRTNDWFFTIESNGLTRKVELYHGSGFLSSSSRKLTLPMTVEQFDITNYMGESRMELLR